MTLLSYVHGASEVPLLGETLGENLRRTVERAGESEALVVRHQGYRATYRELWTQTGRAARGLLARGVRKGDRVGIWSPNRYEWVVVQYATARIGAILVNVNPAYRAAELAHALLQSGTRVLLLARSFRDADYVSLLEKVRVKIPRYWKLTDAFPMTVTGKIQKFRMRETSIAELGLERAARTETA